VNLKGQENCWILCKEWRWWYTGNIFEQCCCHWTTRWDTRPTNDLKYPDENLLPILNGKVPKQHRLATLLKKVALCIFTLRVTLHVKGYSKKHWVKNSSNWVAKGLGKTRIEHMLG